MANYLFNDLNPPRDSANKQHCPLGAASPFQPLLSDMLPAHSISSIPEARRSFSRDPVHDGNTWAQRLNFNTQEEALQKHLKDVVVEPGEKLNLYRRLPFGHILTHLSYMTCCTEDSGNILADINVVDVGDVTNVLVAGPAAIDLTLSEQVVTAVDPAAGGMFLPQDGMGYLCVSLTPPYIDADGYGRFCTDCDDVPCIDLQVRAQMIDVCFTYEHRGCFTGSCGCNSYTFGDCDEVEEGGEEDPKEP